MLLLQLRKDALASLAKEEKGKGERSKEDKPEIKGRGKLE